jgi:hypothetical protein
VAVYEAYRAGDGGPGAADGGAASLCLGREWCREQGCAGAGEHERDDRVTDEVLRGADVIVTMGHSVGVIDIPESVRHEDWRIGDPIGAPIDEIRRCRAGALPL